MGPKGNDHGIVVGAGLELEVEPGTELLAQRVPQRPVEPAAVGGVDHQLHQIGAVAPRPTLPVE